MVGNDIVGIGQVSLLVVFFIYSASVVPLVTKGKTELMVFQALINREKSGNYGVSSSNQQGVKWKLWCFKL